MKCIFDIQLKIEVFHMLIISNQNKKFEYLCNIFQKKIGDEVDLLPEDKYGSFLQVDSIILSVRSQVFPKYLK